MPEQNGCFCWPQITVLICTLNEEANLPYVLPKIPATVHEVLIVDGRSTDNTVSIARQLRPDARVIYQTGRGKGDALQCGIAQATGDIIVTLDADGTTDPEEMAGFVEPLLRGYDFAKGSRFALGRPEKKPAHRIFGNWLIVATANILYRRNYTDLCSGYNAFWKEAFRRINFTADGFEDEPLINVRAIKAGLKIREVPHRDRGRINGETNAPSFRQGWKAIKTVVRERFRSL
ncbi:MAG: glycosyltransferase [Peptococcaceae bacterium]|nr:MAG: glycosyltransferase [Peptococcaceae bacterium]